MNPQFSAYLYNLITQLKKCTDNKDPHFDLNSYWNINKLRNIKHRLTKHYRGVLIIIIMSPTDLIVKLFEINREYQGYLMKIEAVEIKNFRTLENIKVKFDGYFSSISGKNNAGKTSIVRAIRSVFREKDREYSFFDEDESISYSRSKTQWVVDGEPIEFKFKLLLSKTSDPGLHSFIKKIAEIDSLADSFGVLIIVKHKPK